MSKRLRLDSDEEVEEQVQKQEENGKKEVKKRSSKKVEEESEEDNSEESGDSEDDSENDSEDEDEEDSEEEDDEDDDEEEEEESEESEESRKNRRKQQQKNEKVTAKSNQENEELKKKVKVEEVKGKEVASKPSQNAQVSNVKVEEPENQDNQSETDYSDLFKPDDSSLGEIQRIRKRVQDKLKELKSSNSEKNGSSRNKSTKKKSTGEGQRKKPTKTLYQPQLSPKEVLVRELLCRWWYVLPEWPPKNYDYSKVLAFNKMRIVNLKNSKSSKTQQDDGFMKVYPIEEFEGCFKNDEGEFIDARPTKDKPCYDEMIKKSEKELKQLIYRALQIQKEILEKQIKEKGENDYFEIPLKEVIEKLKKYKP